MSRRVGVVGARGHTGAELLRILDSHPQVEIAYAGSRELAGQAVPRVEGLVFENRGPAETSELALDAVFLALPNGVSDPFVSAMASETLIVDISADHRFDDAWVYGLPELNREKISGARRIANPGCYATACQLAIAPFAGLITGDPVVFGVSGYSGAGTTPSPKNDPQRLADNLLPYTLTGHIHEREATRQLGRPIRFSPHVHPAFRGLLVTVHIPVESGLTTETAFDMLDQAYADEALVEVRLETPELRDGTGIDGVVIGGLAVSGDGEDLVLVAAEDNLLKGAAVQAVQNMNLGLGIAEYTGILDGV